VDAVSTRYQKRWHLQYNIQTELDISEMLDLYSHIMPMYNVNSDGVIRMKPMPFYNNNNNNAIVGPCCRRLQFLSEFGSVTTSCYVLTQDTHFWLNKDS